MRAWPCLSPLSPSRSPNALNLARALQRSLWPRPPHPPHPPHSLTSLLRPSPILLLFPGRGPRALSRPLHPAACSCACPVSEGCFLGEAGPVPSPCPPRQHPILHRVSGLLSSSCRHSAPRLSHRQRPRPSPADAGKHPTGIDDAQTEDDFRKHDPLPAEREEADGVACPRPETAPRKRPAQGTRPPPLSVSPSPCCSPRPREPRGPRACRGLRCRNPCPDHDRTRVALSPRGGRLPVTRPRRQEGLGCLCNGSPGSDPSLARPNVWEEPPRSGVQARISKQSLGVWK